MISAADIVRDHKAYADIRSDRRASIIPVREARRVPLGDLVSLEFENDETLTFQTQEMVYTERLEGESEISHEIEAYSRMLPSSDSLVATLFIYLRNPEAISYELKRLQGLHTSIAIEIGDLRAAGVPITPADQDDDDVTVSVHVLRFTFDEPARAAFLDASKPASIVVDHAEYSEDAPIPPDVREHLIADLAS